MLVPYKYLAFFYEVKSMKEIWKDIKGYEGYYQISNFGRVKSVERMVCNHKSGSTRLVQERFLSPTDNGHGYKMVKLNIRRTRTNKYVHRLVAEHFLDNPLKKKYINHLDYDTSNNAVTNLEWCTQSENVLHSIEHMRKPRTKSRPSNTGEKYITKRIYHGNCVRYRVLLRNKGIDKSFKTLEEAIYFRNEVI